MPFWGRNHWARARARPEAWSSAEARNPGSQGSDAAAHAPHNTSELESGISRRALGAVTCRCSWRCACARARNLPCAAGSVAPIPVLEMLPNTTNIICKVCHGCRDRTLTSFSSLPLLRVLLPPEAHDFLSAAQRAGLRPHGRR